MANIAAEPMLAEPVHQGEKAARKRRKREEKLRQDAERPPAVLVALAVLQLIVYAELALAG